MSERSEENLPFDDGARVSEFRQAIERAAGQQQVLAEGTITGLFAIPG